MRSARGKQNVNGRDRVFSVLSFVPWSQQPDLCCFGVRWLVDLGIHMLPLAGSFFESF